MPSRLASYLKVTTALVALLSNTVAWAQQLPTGGTVAVGNAAIGTAHNGTLNINQSSNQAVINWNSFSVGRGGTINFNQPSSSSATLNRVTGGTPSWIAGTINAPGTVLLVNPNGIAITKSGVINTGSFAASTLDISNADFMAGNYKFTGNGGSAAVRNAGRINVSDGGFAALLGGQVANSGVISARLGKVGLGAGELVTLDFAGDGFLSVAVPSTQVGRLVDQNGALVTNSGKIRANGGQVFLSAATATNILRDAVNVPGSIRANTVGSHNGRIVIGGGSGRVNVTGKLVANGNSKRNGGKIEIAGSAVNLNGKIAANGKNGGNIVVAGNSDLAVAGKVEAKGNDGQGGRIDLTGANVRLIGALIDASGTTGGGLVRIGGTFQGGHGDPNDPLYRSFVGRFGALPAVASAQTVTIDAGSKIDVSARRIGDGGTVVVWSEQYTSYSGTITGTSAAGNGGFAEVSSHGVLDFVGMAALGATAGASGTLLLDPENLIITGAGTDNVTSASGGGTTTLTANATTSNLKASTITALLNATTNVSVIASGDITVNSAISWTGTGSNGNTSLTLNAGGNLLVSANVTALKTSGSRSNNTITLIAGNDITIGSGITFTTSNNNTTGVNAITFLAGRNISIGSTVAVTNSGATNILLRADSGGTGLGTVNFTSSAIKATSSGGGIVSIFYNPSVNPAGSAVNSTSYVNPTESFTANRGSGTTLNSYMLVNSVNDLQNMKNNLSGSYGLGRNIDASATAGWNGGLGFAPIGSAVSNGTGIPADGTTFGVSSANPFAGNFNGQNYTISNLTINRPNTDYVGLFGYAYNTTGTQLIQNVNLVGGSITGRDNVGGVLGGSRGYLADGTGVTINFNDYNNSSTSSATVSGRDFVGGLYGSVETAYGYNVNGSGNVSGRDYVGGIVGWLSASSGFFTDFRSTATVSGGNNVGGVGGYFYAGIYGLNYATGNINATGNNVGGMMGYLYGSLNSSGTHYATGQVTGANNVGGLVGFNAGAIGQAFATGTVTGVTNVGGLVGNNDVTVGSGFIDLSFATGVVNGVTNVGGLVGYNTNVIGALNNTGGNYATGAVYGTTNVGGLVGSNIGDSSTTFGKIFSGYSTGYVSGTTNVGGFVGNSTVSGANAYIKSSYFNTETSGKSNALGTGTTGTGGIAVGTMGKTTAQMQSMAIGTGGYVWSTTAWGIVANTSLPYFKWLYPAAPQVVTGTAYSDRGTTPLVGAAANMLVSGLSGTAANVAASAVGSTGANGLFSFLVPNGTFAAAGKQVLVYTAGANGGATFQEKTTASLAGASALNVYGTYLKEQATSTSTLLSTVDADLALAVNGNAAALTRLNTLANLEIDATAASFAIDQAISTGTLVLSGTGTWTQPASITATNLMLLGSGATYTLTNASNAITNLGTVTLGAGSLNLVDTGGLTVTGAVGATGGVTLNTSGALAINNTINTGAGNVSLTTTGAGNDITQGAGGGITANTLTLSTANGNATLTAGTNTFAGLGAAMGTGALAITDSTAGTLTTSTITANGGVAISNVGNISSGGGIQASSGTLALTSTAGSITANGLYAPGVTVTAAINASVSNVTTLGAVGAVILTATSGSLTVSNIDTLSGSSAGVSLTAASSLSISGYLFGNLGIVSLTVTGAGGTITQTASSTLIQGAGLVANAVNGSVDLTQGGISNRFTTVAGRSSGDFAYTNRSGNLAIGTVAGTSGIVSTGGNVTVIAQGSGTPFPSGAQLAVNQAVQASSGNVTLQAAGNMAINAAVAASTGGAGVISLTTTGAGSAITQNASGVLTANSLLLTTNGGNAILDTATNAVSGITSVSLGTGAFALKTAAAGGFTVSAGSITANGGIAVANTIGSISTVGNVAASNGAVALTATSAGSGITLGGSVTGVGVTLNSNAALTLNNNIDGGAGTVSLNSTGGAINQTAGKITSNAVTATAAGAVDLRAALNQVGSVGGSSNGTFNFYNFSQALTVNNVSSQGGQIAIANTGAGMTVPGAVNSGGGNIILFTSAGTLAINGAVTASGASVGLQGAAGITQSAAGVITATRLIAGSLTGDIALTADNAVTGNVGLNATGGSVSFTNTSGFVVGGISSINFGSVGTFVITPGIRTSLAGSTTLTAGGNVMQASGSTNIISTGTLILSSAANANVTLDNANNVVTNLGAVAIGNGALTLVDTGDLTVTGAVTAKGGVTLETSGILAVNNTIDAGNANIFFGAADMAIADTVTTTGTITIAPVTAGTTVALGNGTAPAGLVIDNNELFLLGSASTLSIGRNRAGVTTAGAIEIGQAIVDNARLDLFTGAGITLTSGLGMTVGGGTGALNISAGGTVKLTTGSTGGIAVGTVAGSTTNGHFLVNGGNSSLAVGSAGITTAGGEILVRNYFGDLSIGGALTSNGGNMLVGASNQSGSPSVLTIGADINAGAGSIGLFGFGGAITQTGGKLIGNNLLVAGGGDISLAFGTLPGTANQIGGKVILNAGVSGAGDVSFANAGGFQLGGFSNITYSSIGGSISPSVPASLSTTGTATLTAGGNITQGAGAADGVLADTLVVAGLGGAGVNVTLGNANNAVNNVGAVTLGTGKFQLENSGDLTITGAATAGGGYEIITGGALTQNAGANIDTSGGNGTIALASDGGCGCSGGTDLTLNANLKAGTGVVMLGASGSIIQSAGAITADSVTAEAISGSVSLNSATNSFAGIDGASDGDFSAVTLRSLTVGTAGLGVVFSPGGTVSLTALGATSDIEVSDALGGGIVGNNVTLTAGRDILVNGGIGAFQTTSLLAGRNITDSATGFVAGDSLRAVATTGAVDLTNGTNGIGTIAGLANGNFRYAQDGSLTVGTVGPSNGITSSTAGVTVNAGTGDITIDTLARVIANSDIVLAGSGFFNDRGSDALASTTGRWLVYADAPRTAADYNGLNSGNTAIWNTTYPAPVTATGNRYVFAETAALTFTPDDVSKVYGDVATLTYTITGLKGGVTGAYLGDTQATATSGAPVLSSAGVAATAQVAGIPYAITLALNTLAGRNGYTVAAGGPGSLTVTPKALTVTAENESKIYGSTFAFAGTEFTTSGLINGDTVTSATLASTGSAATATVAGSSYAITGRNAQGTGLSNYTISYANGAMTVTPKALTVTANNQSKVYGDTVTFAGTEFTTNGLANGDTVTAATLASTGSSATATVTGGAYAITGSNAQGTGLSNYTISYANGAMTVTQRALTVTVNNQSKVYGDTFAFTGTQFTTNGLVNGDTVASVTQTSAGAAAGASVAGGPYAITGSNSVGTGLSNYTIGYVNGVMMVSPATLTYVANAASRPAGTQNPAFSGTVTGFVNGETQLTATTGALSFTSLADNSSPPGGYAINGSGLGAANYIFVQAAGNATALTIGTALANNPTSQFGPPNSGRNSPGVNIAFQNASGGPISISYTPPAPPARVASTPSNDIAPASLPTGQDLATNNGLTYPPISQFDPNQYSQFKTSDWADQAGLATMFTMIARGVDREHAADAFIDGFWNGTGPSWTPPPSFAGKVTFSDGAGNAVSPAGSAGFPIAAGATDFGPLLKRGPVMISDGAASPHWLLATQLTADGKGIVANDPASGKQVVLNYDAATKTIGGVTSVFDATSGKFVAFAEASTGTPALVGLQSFVPASFLAVSAK